MKYNVTGKHNTGHLIILKKNLKLKDTQAPFPSPYDLTEVLEIIESIFVPLKAESLLWVAFLPLLKAYVFPSRRGVCWRAGQHMLKQHSLYSESDATL